jgi:hypothetical protein
LGVVSNDWFRDDFFRMVSFLEAIFVMLVVDLERRAAGLGDSSIADGPDDQR